MPKFMLMYVGDATDMSDMSEDQVKEVMGKWGAWIEGVGSALADVGSPTGPSSSVVDDGSDGTPLNVTGYSIVEADDMAGAKALCEGHPFLNDNDGLFSISIHELMPVPEM